MTRSLLAIALFFSAASYSQNWTWVRGSSSGSIAGTYGTQGVAASTNDPGGRHGCATWTDKAGNLWVFGGEGYTTTPVEDLLNDLWKYDISNNEWTWVRGAQSHNAPGVYGTKGTPAPGNDPGAREFSVSWTDTAGNFWLFGGEGYDVSGTFGALGDLWRYNPTTNEWTWMHGFNTVDQNGIYGTMGVSSTTNSPGTRAGSGYWRDNNNNFWMYGGEGFPATGTAGRLNDLWKYTPALNSWTWMKGSDLAWQAGTYGTVAVTASTNLPGGRSFPGTWTANNGDMYMLGGVGHGTMSLLAHLSDLWKYEPASNNWTWMGGHYGGNFNGHYGTQGQPSASVKPGSRHSPATWVDALGKLWLFGGFGYAGGQSSHGNLNDLFNYDPSIGQWTWVKGDTLLNMPGVQGTMGVASSLNKPGARHYNTYWRHTGARFWMLGGLGTDPNPSQLANRNDLWVFDAPCNDSVAFAENELCSGQSATLTVTSPDGSALTWYNSPTSTVAMGSGTVFVTAPLPAIASPSIFTYYAGAATCSQSARSAVTLTVYPEPQISIAGASSVCAGESFTLAAQGAATYTWNTGSTLTVISTSASAPGYTAVVIGLDTNMCENSATHVLTVQAAPDLAAGLSSTVACIDEVVTFSVSGAGSYSWSTGQTTSSFTSTVQTAGVYVYSVTGFNQEGCSSVKTLTLDVQLCTGITGTETGNLVLISPNPSEGAVRINYSGASQASLRITDNLGKIIFSGLIQKEQDLLFQDLPAGLYHCVVAGSGGTYSAKLIVR